MPPPPNGNTSRETSAKRGRGVAAIRPSPAARVLLATRIGLVSRQLHESIIDRQSSSWWRGDALQAPDLVLDLGQLGAQPLDRPVGLGSVGVPP